MENLGEVGNLGGVVMLSHGLVHCNIVGCLDSVKFKWRYKNETEDRVQVLAEEGNIIPFVGNGTYYAEASCSIQKLLVSNTFSDTVIEHNRTPAVQPPQPPPVSFEWDFDKIPKGQKTAIRKLYKAEKWKDLAMLHNKWGLSRNGYCCDMSGVKENFGKWLGIDAI